MSSGGGGVIPVVNVGHEGQEDELHQAPTLTTRCSVQMYVYFQKQSVTQRE